MRVLVSGAGGFLGRYVVARLLASGHTVRATVRNGLGAPGWLGEVDIVSSDLRTGQKLDAMFIEIDAVVHLAAATSGGEDQQFASTVVGTENFLRAMAKSQVRRLIHISSLVVYDWSKAVDLLDEQTPLRTNFYDMGGYTIAKIWQERLATRVAQESEWQLTILRPGFIWGPGHSEIAGMGRHVGRAYLMFGPFTRLPLCHVANCADAVVTALENSASIDQTFNLIDEDSVRVWRYVKEYAKGTHQRGIFVPLPYSLGMGMARAASFVSRRLFGKKGRLPSLFVPPRFEAQFKPVRFSNSKLRNKLGWHPPLSFRECVAHTYVSSQ
jgi:nucleoside-diphosphate-sugar epimerase